MLDRLRASLLLRSALVGLAVTVLVGLLALSLAGRIARRRETEHQRLVMEALLDVVEPSASAACYVEDRALAGEVVRGLLKSRNVQHAALGSGGRILAEAGQAGGTERPGTAGAVTRQLLSPFNPREQLGQLVLVPDAGERELQVARTLALLRTVVLSLALGLGLALALTVHLSIVRPLTNLSNRLHQVEGGQGPGLDLPRGHESDEIGQLVRDINALMRRLLLSSNDLATANARLAEALVRAETASQAKSTFLATISHEIRTPMNGMIGMTSLLLQTPLEARQRHLAETVQESSEALMQIINDVLDFSKMEAGKLELDPHVFRLGPLVAGTVDLLAPRFKEKAIRLDCQVPAESDGLYLGDSGRIRQILLNLLGNAIKFTERGSVVLDLATREAGEDILLRVSVTDTGIGIPLQAQDRLFSMFSQADPSMTRRYGGSGLGLVICKRLVELMGGEIGFQSQEGVGSTFWFELPLRRQAASAQPAQEEPGSGTAEGRRSPRPASGRARRILVAEDNPVNQEVAQGLLVGLGHQVDVASDGQEALDLVATGAYDLVFMDMQMPRLDGLAATRRIRALEGPGRQVPIIAMTANAMESDHQRCLEAGMDDYLSKPFNQRRLKAVLERFAPPRLD